MHLSFRTVLRAADAGRLDLAVLVGCILDDQESEVGWG